MHRHVGPGVGLGNAELYPLAVGVGRDCPDGYGRQFCPIAVGSSVVVTHAELRADRAAVQRRRDGHRAVGGKARDGGGGRRHPCVLDRQAETAAERVGTGEVLVARLPLDCPSVSTHGVAVGDGAGAAHVSAQLERRSSCCAAAAHGGDFAAVLAADADVRRRRPGAVGQRHRAAGVAVDAVARRGRAGAVRQRHRAAGDAVDADVRRGRAGAVGQRHRAAGVAVDADVRRRRAGAVRQRHRAAVVAVDAVARRGSAGAVGQRHRAAGVAVDADVRRRRAGAVRQRHRAAVAAVDAVVRGGPERALVQHRRGIAIEMPIGRIGSDAVHADAGPREATLPATRRDGLIGLRHVGAGQRDARLRDGVVQRRTSTAVVVPRGGGAVAEGDGGAAHRVDLVGARIRLVDGIGTGHGDVSGGP